MPNETTQPLAPVAGADQIALLERLCNASGVSGDEGEVRNILLEAVRPLADTVKVDALGNVIAYKEGQGDNRLRVMLDAHMDEIGLMITAEDGDGLFQFTTVGGVDARHLPGKPVLVGKDHIPGVIGARAIHLTTADERRQAIPLTTLRIDVGPGENGKRVQVGDRAVFATRFRQVGPSIMAKAIDDRIGCATLVELLRAAPENIDLYAVFSTQEEIGGRGAQVASYGIHPDLAVAVDSTPAYDLPAWDGEENARYNTKLGAGPAVYPFDRGTISDPRLVRWLIETAERHGIPYQVRQPGGGGTDAAAIQRTRGGIPAVSISVPGRYAHTAVLLCRLEDWNHTLRLLHAALADLNRDVLAE